MQSQAAATYKESCVVHFTYDSCPKGRNPLNCILTRQKDESIGAKWGAFSHFSFPLGTPVAAITLLAGI
jgi:hypothetical protein